ncbi:MAG: ATP-binding protein [Lachnospiraceae bacterium]|nr:ATP-binding protein [Lachnospiraceae bacterium]
MPLTTNQFRNLIREYDQRRSEAQRIHAERMDEIRARVPGYSELEDEATGTAMRYARMSIADPNTDLSMMDAELDRINRRKEELLKENGYDLSYLTVPYKCQDCEDTGYIGGRKCHCFKQAELHVLYDALYDKSNLHSLIETDNFDSMREDLYSGEDLVRFREAVRMCRDYIARFDTDYSNLLFVGSVGTGKSFLSSCIAHELLMSGHSVLYFSASDFFDTCAHNAFRRGDEGALDTDNDLYDCDLLIIDDLGTEYANQFVSSELFSCLNARHNKRRSTIINTNLSLKFLQERYSDRVLSRITGYYTILKLTGPDLRMKLRTANI